MVLVGLRPLSQYTSRNLIIRFCYHNNRPYFIYPMGRSPKKITPDGISLSTSSSSALSTTTSTTNLSHSKNISESSSSMTTDTSHSKSVSESSSSSVSLTKNSNSISTLHSHPTNSNTHYVGYHASGAGGIWKALEAGHSVGAKALAFFTRTSRSWIAKPLKEDDIEKFHQLMAMYNYLPHHILPHGTYLSNLGTPTHTDLYEKSIEGVYDEALRCYQLGLLYYNFHPGSYKYCLESTTTTTSSTIQREPLYQGCYNVAQAINVLHQRVPRIIFVIEIMAGQGNILGSTLEEIRYMIDHVHDKTRVGVCIDTAHTHGSGYDLTNSQGYNTFMEQFDTIIGLQYLKGMHLNDSKVLLNSKIDRHENIGKGYVGIECFRCIMNDQRTANIPLILETPCHEKDDITIYKQEIALLYSLQNTKENDPVILPIITKSKSESGSKTKKRKGKHDNDEEENTTNDEDEVELALVTNSSNTTNSTVKKAKQEKQRKRSTTTSTIANEITKEEIMAKSLINSSTIVTNHDHNNNITTPDINQFKYKTNVKK